MQGSCAWRIGVVARAYMSNRYQNSQIPLPLSGFSRRVSSNPITVGASSGTGMQTRRMSLPQYTELNCELRKPERLWHWYLLDRGTHFFGCCGTPRVGAGFEEAS